MKTTTITTLSALTLPFTAFAEEAPKDVATQFKTLIEATQENDLEKFESVCDAKMQEAMTPQVLEQVSKQVSPLLKAGYQSDFMGDLNKLSHTTYYWKIDFNTEQAPDMLAEMTIANGKVAGFFIR
ncbi:hypothetical protein ACFPK9_09185 [Rubritalea spongiae]|uniref:DUF3887 domain-containing protein n=1 Tax=Rubritalea spongiae TaxID=430797 RepID=A0ABW5E270_9BACT